MDSRRAEPGTDPTVRFSERALAYASGRPHYPPAIVAHLARELELAPGAVIVDLGSGTGLSSRIFLQAGFQVIGVEPNARMREQAEQALAGVAGFVSVAATAQATTLDDACADCVIAAQAFHWFDVDAVRTEALRILRRPPRAGQRLCAGLRAAGLRVQPRAGSRAPWQRGFDSGLLWRGALAPQRVPTRDAAGLRVARSAGD